MKLGIIGLGDIAQKAYLPYITQLAGVELVFSTRSSEVMKSLAQQYRISEVCSDYRELLKSGVDAVMIHAATSAHVQLAKFFLEKGVPTFVDKPLADNADDVDVLYELAISKGVPLYVGFNRRHIPLYNQHVTELANGKVGDLLSLRWEKHRFDLPGDIRTFIFDDFIHPLDSINLNAQSSLEGVEIFTQKVGDKLGRIDVQWQTGNTLLQASMNRQFGITRETVSACYQNRAYEFDSFVSGKYLQNNSVQQLNLKDWTPMLASKGFHSMMTDWLQVVDSNHIDSSVIERNIASHRLADNICRRLEAALE
ncbi:oxidoreductase [Vibrio ishigakensis]|uniref:Oxidoreductase n=1 Tax=Vibrio ishigakensis TaxID=1481914 RepID=A0A0B8NSG0_9VIBR|nr:Gfo/Idh/MocA family oxidoreductase [Vibrio ishigakensis]GAM54088.1 oxidoreductase [Vibrio ishigakensis]